MNIRQTLSQSRPALRLVALMVLLLAALTFTPPPPALAQSSPDPVSSVSVTRADGSLTASWSAPARATAYHVTYSSDGGASWNLAAGRHGGTSITIGVKNGATYIVGVRAGNDYGWSTWRNSPSSGPYTPPPPTTPPGTPSSVSITRADGTLTASWSAVSGATKYHVTYSSNNGKNWSLAAFNHASSSITVGVENGGTYIVGVRAGNQHGWSGWRNSAPSGPYYPPTPPPATPSNLKAYGGVKSVTLAWDDPGDSSIYYYEYQHRKDSDAEFGAWTATPKGSGGITSYTVTGLTNGTKYHFRLRAVGSGGTSAPTSSVSATPEDGVTIPKPQPGIQPPERPESVTLTRAAGTLTADWPDVERATSYHVTYTADGGASWTLAALKHTTSGITITGVSDTATYVVAVRGHNDSGYGQWRNSAPIAPLPPPSPSLSVSNITSTGATFTLSGHTGTWSYKVRIDQGSGTCITPVSSPTTTVTLLSNKTYHATAYSGAGCTEANALDTVYFSTTDVAVGNLAESLAPASCSVGNSFGPVSVRCAVPFTTGNVANGYTLNSISARFSDKAGININARNNLGSITVAIHAEDTGNSSNPAASPVANATFTGADPDTEGLYSYACSGNGCDLNANTTYFVVFSTTDTTNIAWYALRTTTSDDETKHPAGNGWSIANVSRNKLGSDAWTDFGSSRTGVLHIAANEK